MADTEFRKRLITGIGIGAVIIGATLGGPITAYILILLIVTGSVIEFFRMRSPNTPYPFWAGFLATLPVITFAGDVIQGEDISQNFARDVLISVILVFFWFFIGRLISKKGFELEEAGKMSLAIFMITLPCVFACALILISPRLLLGIFILLWCSDVFAYFGGRAFGKHKLLPSVSPKKTWEGVMSGLIMAGVASWGLSYIFPEIALKHWIITAALVVIFGTLGDLMQSAIKRACGVKDSGNILPGHGGIWDRFDSFLGCAPWIGAYYLLFYL